MSNRKSSNAPMSNDGNNAQENTNAMYTAHQVHTLANMIYRQMAAPWNAAAPWTAQAPWSPVMNGAMTQPFLTAPYGMTPEANAGCAQGAPGFLPPPALFYWYP